jgi:four helix bundle protein
MGFHATDHAFEAIRHIAPVLVELKGQDSDLADQIRRAAVSIVLNLEEGSWKTGRDRINRYRIAAGSAAEVRAALKVAAAFGYVREEHVIRPIGSLDQMLAIVWSITGKPA